MTKNNILGSFFPFAGQGDSLVWGIVDHPLAGKGSERFGDRCSADTESSRNLLAPGNEFFFNDVVNGLDVVFQAGAEDFLAHNMWSAWSGHTELPRCWYAISELLLHFLRCNLPLFQAGVKFDR